MRHMARKLLNISSDMVDYPLSAETFKAIACGVVPAKQSTSFLLHHSRFGRYSGEAPLVLRNSEARPIGHLAQVLKIRKKEA